MLDYKSIEKMYCGIKPTGFAKHYLTLFAIVEGLETKNSFEFGTGISTKVILEALDYTGGKHVSCDTRNINDTGLSEEYLRSCGGAWTYLQRDSLNINFNAFDYFDFVLHDGSHIPSIVEQDLRNIFPHIKNDGILLLHDGLFIPEIEDVCKKVVEETNSQMLTLPFGYGLTIVRINNKNTEERVKPLWKKF